MLSVKSSGSLKTLLEKEDSEFKVVPFATSGVGYKNISEGIFKANKFQAIISGYLVMKTSSFGTGQVLFNLPLGYKSATISSIACTCNSGAFACYTEANGDRALIYENKSFVEDELVFVSAVINLGGG